MLGGLKGGVGRDQGQGQTIREILTGTSRGRVKGFGGHTKGSGPIERRPRSAVKH